MSTQPSLLSDLSHPADQWHIYLKLADTLSTQFSLKSLLEFSYQVFEQSVSCVPSIWLAPIASNLVQEENLGDDLLIQTDRRTILMEAAYREKRISPNIQSSSQAADALHAWALPLLVADEVYGIIQLEKSNKQSFNPGELEIYLSFSREISLGLAYLIKYTYTEYVERSSAHLAMVEEIVKSFLSILDRENLYNSVLSLLHQSFDYPQVDLYLPFDDDRKIFKQIKISTEGIVAGKAFPLDQAPMPVIWSINHLQPVIIDNHSASLFLSSTNYAEHIDPQIIIPLLNGDQLFGVLTLYGPTVEVFGPDMLKGLYLLAQNLAIAIRNANFFNIEQARRVLNERIQQVSGQLSVDVSFDDTLQILLAELEKSVPMDAAAIWWEENMPDNAGLGEFSSPLRLGAHRVSKNYLLGSGQRSPGDAEDSFDLYYETTDDEQHVLDVYSWMAEIISSGDALIKKAASVTEPVGEALLLNGNYSAIGVPLIKEDRAAGIIITVHHLPYQYDRESISLLNTFAAFASIAIENCRLFVAAHDQAWVSTVLLQVAEATQSITKMDELLDTLVSVLPGLIGVEACMIFLWDPSVEAFFPQASSGYDEPQVERLSTLEVFPGTIDAFDQMSQNTQPIILSNDNLPKEVIDTIFTGYDFANNLLVLFPLVTQNSLCGAILIDFSNSGLGIESPQYVWDEKFALIEGAARQTATAIENLQLIKAQEEEAYISNALLQVAQAIVSNKKLDEILESIVRITPILVGVKRCIIYIWDSKERVFRSSENYGFSKTDLTLLGEAVRGDEFPLLAAILQDKQILYYPLASGYSPATWLEIAAGEASVVEGGSNDSDQAVSIRLDSRSMISRERLLFGFPLSVKGDVLGVMLIEEEEPLRGAPSLHIREKRIEIVKGITQQAAIAIQNELLQQEAVKSERMERELQLAREIQTTFLPERLPETPGWDIAVRWQPARQVAGDFYDILSLPDNQVGLVIADVADKGMPAALFMTLIRTLIRSATREKQSPAVVLKQVNDLLFPDSKHSLFVTVFYGVLSLDSGRFVYANAGHNPPVIKHARLSDLKELTRTGIALGIFNNIEVEDRELYMEPGDWILLYTDGVTEAFSAEGEMFGIDRLHELLLGSEFISADALLNSIEESVSEFITGTDLSDDITLTAVYRKAH